MRKLTGLMIVGTLLSFGEVASAGPIEDGHAAASRGEYATAMKLWRPLAEQGDAIAQYNLGWGYRNGRGVPQDYKEAVKWFRKAADQGDADAQLNLGLEYYLGQGVPKDYAEAATWFRKAADQGKAKAQQMLGLEYYLARISRMTH